ncbi:hypothetical protein AWB69_00021 [Caballeronia udeis]|uniref:Uncharacterized protein n=1 Tax=Caballeronia udeis TaxID=1232866 RepID=A0A158EQE8_9BURK|nr:hypothetical protein [Caballeronia udeis]SAL09319.1 hypothetical protein AWB69_00021 [Caballeronia udeis]
MEFDLASAVPIDPNQGAAPVSGATPVAVPVAAPAGSAPTAVPPSAAAPQPAQGGFDLASAVPVTPQGQQPAGAPAAAAPGFLDRLRLPNEDPNSIENTIRRGFGAPAVGKNPEFEKVANADTPFPDVLPVAPSTLKDLASAAVAPVKYLLRGGDSNAPAIAKAIDTFGKAGTSPSVGQATGGRVAQATESLLGKYPGGAGVMAKKADSQASEIGQQAEKIADSLSPNATPSVAGRAIEKGLTGPGGFVDRFKQGQKALYAKLDQYIKPQAPVAVSNTSKALASMNEDIDGAEALSKFFKNGKIQDIESALKSDTAGTQAGVLIVPPNATTAEQRAAASHGLLRRQAPEVREGQAPLAGKISATRNPYTGATREPVSTAGTPPTVSIQPGTSAIPSYAGGQRVPIPGGSPTNQLPYEALKKLRTLVGNEISDSNMSSSVPRSKWKALYGALSSDLDAAAKATGNPDAVKAMDRANQFTRAGHARIDDVLDKVAKQDIPEKIFKSAVNPADMEAGATKIGSIMKSLQPDERDVVKSAFIRRMGTASAGQQGAEGGKFSSQTFLTNWGKMSPQAKSVMFASADGNLRKSLDSIAQTADRIKQGSKVLANPSGSGPVIAATGLVTSVGTALGTGNFKLAAGLLSSAAGANLTARMMTNPRFVSWLARATKIQNPELARQAVLSLGKTMQGEPDDVQEDAQRYADAAANSFQPTSAAR